MKELRSLTHVLRLSRVGDVSDSVKSALLTGLQEVVHKPKEGGCGQSDWLVHRPTAD